MIFRSIDDFHDRVSKPVYADGDSIFDARRHQRNLTKPRASLGRLEDIALWLSGWQKTPHPHVDSPHILLFAGNHGVVGRGVSHWPMDVTGQMVENFHQGGAAINHLSLISDLKLSIHPLSLEHPTQDFTKAPAMGEKECLEALNIGANGVKTDCDIVLLGEMGIGNSTISAALCAACLGGCGTDWAGRGAGHDETHISLKAAIIDEALALHTSCPRTPFEILRHFGGREQAAIAGAVLAARHKAIPVLLDGFICTAAMLPLYIGNEDIFSHCMIAHLSGEQGHYRLLSHLSLSPLLDLGMRLGEGSGAAIAFHIIKSAVATHNGMACFSDIGIKV